MSLYPYNVCLRIRYTKKVYYIARERIGKVIKPSFVFFERNPVRASDYDFI